VKPRSPDDAHDLHVTVATARALDRCPRRPSGIRDPIKISACTDSGNCGARLVATFSPNKCLNIDHVTRLNVTKSAISPRCAAR
jgi:hypothetical protein